MNKKYLGLGFTFAAIDDGLKNMFRQVGNEVQGLGKGLEETSKKGAEMFDDDGVFGKMMNFAKLGVLGKISGQLADVKKGLLGEDREDVTFKTLEQYQRDLVWAGKLTKEQSEKMRTDLLDVAKASGAMTDDMASVAVSLMKAGVPMDTVSANLKRMGQLMGSFGMKADSVSELLGEGLSKRLGMSSAQMDDFVEKSVSFSRQFKMPPNMDALPGILKAINDNAAFKNLKGKAAQEAAQGIQKMAVMFQALGNAPDVASQAAVDMFAKMKEIEKGFAKIETGLEGDIDSFYKNALITNAQKAMQAMKSNDPATMFFSLREAMGAAAKAGGNAMQVTTMWMDEAFGPKVLNAAQARWDGLGKSMTDASKASTKTDFTDYITETEKMLFFQRQMTEASEDAMKVTAKFAARDDIIVALKLQRDAYDQITKSIQGGDGALAKFITTSEKFAGGGLNAFLQSPSLAGLGAAGGVVGEYLGVLIEKLSMLGFAFQGLKGLFGLAGGGFKKLGSGIMWVAEKLGILDKVARVAKMPFLKMKFEFLKLTRSIGGMNGILKIAADLLLKTFKAPFKFIYDTAKAVFNLRGAIVGLAKYAQNLWNIFKAGGSALGLLTGGLKLGGKLLTRLAYPIGIVLSALEGLYTTWGELTAAFSAWDSGNMISSLMKIGKALTSTLLVSLDSFFLGLPSRILGDWVTSLDGWKSSFMDMWLGIVKWVKDTPLLGRAISDDYLKSVESSAKSAKEAFDKTMEARKGTTPQPKQAGPDGKSSVVPVNAKDNVLDMMKYKQERQVPGQYKEDKIKTSETVQTEPAKVLPMTKTSTEKNLEQKKQEIVQKEIKQKTEGFNKMNESSDMSETIAAAIEEGINRVLMAGMSVGTGTPINVTVTLEGDVRKFMKVQKTITDGTSTGRGTYAG